MTDAECDNYVRCLRFPPDLERAFQEDYYSKFRGTLRVVALVMAVFCLLPSLREYLNGESPKFIFSIYGPPALGVLFLLVLTFWSRFASCWQPITVATLCIVLSRAFAAEAGMLSDRGIRILRQMSVSADSFVLDYTQTIFFSMLAYIVMVWVAMFRLQFIWMTALLFGIQFIAVWAILIHLEASTWRVFNFLQGSTLVTFMLMISALVQERFARSEFLANHLLDAEREKSEMLLLNVLPQCIAMRLKGSSESIADDHEEVTVLFADVADFTAMAAGLSARSVLHLLNDIFSRFDRLAEKYGLEKIKTIGDCYMVVCGAPVARLDHLETVARYALAIQAEAENMSRQHERPVSFRIGVESGPLAAGVIGRKKFLYDVWGDTVNTASRMESHGVAGKIQVTEKVAMRLQDRFLLSHRGLVDVKGKGSMNTYWLEAELPQEAQTLMPIPSCGVVSQIKVK